MLEHLNLPLGIVNAIVGQTRLMLRFTGRESRRHHTDGLEEGCARGRRRMDSRRGISGEGDNGLVATVGQLQVEPGATNIVPGAVPASLDVRHASDEVRRHSVARMIASCGKKIALQRRLEFSYGLQLDQSAVIMDPASE